jgi:cytochrome c551/c552
LAESAGCYAPGLEVALTAALWKKFGLTIVGLLALIQLVPYGRSHQNPAVRREPRWDAPETRALAVRACFDCHSNQTVWPAYSNVAPMSWIIQSHVDDGRRHLNFSEWDRPQKHADEAAESVKEGEMPLGGYVPFHPQAALSEAEMQALLQGLERTFGARHEHGHAPH